MITRRNSITDPSGTEVAEGSRTGGDVVRLQNFADAIRGAAPLHAEIDEGVKNTLLSGDGPATRRIDGDADAMKLWSREYRLGWEPNV